MPFRGYMIKFDTVFVQPSFLDGNGLLVIHPGRMDPRFIERLKAFMDEFEYEYVSSHYDLIEDYSRIIFAFQGEIRQ